MPLISIIIPTFNSSKTILKCLNSIIEQTFKNFEIIIQDGLSNDDTVDKIKGINDNRIRLYSEKDTGIYNAMNKALIKSEGNWIYFLGSDDYLYSNTVLSNITKYFNENHVVYGNVYSSRFNGIYDGEFDSIKIQQKNICHQAIFFKKEVFKILGNFNERFVSLADWEHNIKWFFSKRIKKMYINLVIANYSDDGFSSTNPDIFFNNIKNWILTINKKDSLTIIYKVKIIKNELFSAFRERRRKDILMILKDSPAFLLNV